MNRFSIVAGVLCLGCAAARAQGLGLGNWDKGAHAWRYQGDQVGVDLGRAQVKPSLADTEVALGGIRLDSQLGNLNSVASSWDFSVAAGAFDRSVNRAAGDLSYREFASLGQLTVRPSQQWSLASDLQTAPGLVSSSLRTQFQSRQFGTFRVGLGGGRHRAKRGWGYQTYYQVRLWDHLALSWQTDHRSPGYADLTSYQQTGEAQGMRRQRLTAGLISSSGSSLSGTYEYVRQPTGPAQQRFGMTRQVWYSPNVKVGFKASHERISRDYDVGLTVSFPIK